MMQLRSTVVMASGDGPSGRSLYDQEEKKICRKELIESAIKSLTTEREISTCVHRDHVRKAWAELHRSQPGSEATAFTEEEITDIEKDIHNWELLHDSKVGTRKPSDLRVCYLAGDNPLNDFNVFVENGVLPQNMWAIEKDAKTLKKALDSIKEAQKMPNVFKGNLLDFLRDFEGQFDIIYFDACGSLPSLKQETLKAIGYVFLYNKLTSPGALITTFSFPPKQTEEAASNASSQDNERQYLNELTREYLKHRFVNTSNRSDVANKIPFFNEEFLKSRTDEENYSEYIVYQIIDTAYMYIPAHRMLTSKKDSILEQSFVKKGDIKEAIKELLPQVIKEGKESASKMWNNLRELESIERLLNLHMEIKGRRQEQLELQIQEEIELTEVINRNMMNCIIDFSRALASSTVESETGLLPRDVEEYEKQMQQHQEVLEDLCEEQIQADQWLQETQSKLDELEEKKQRSIHDLSEHEAHPPRNLSQLGEKLQSLTLSSTSSNPLCKTWASEVFPDWKSDWEISLLLMTHLLTNWIALIDKCSNKHLKDCLELIKQFGDGEDANRWRIIFSQFLDIPDEEVTTQMIATLLYGQMACPSFPVLEKLKRLEYTAKTRQMFSNLFIFDRCRYVYDQFPSVHTSTSVARPHKQIAFRMAVDGLRKHIRHICDEDVFKGCIVVGHGMNERVAVIPEPSEITAQSHDDLQHDRDSSPDLAAQSLDNLQLNRDSSPELATESQGDIQQEL